MAKDSQFNHILKTPVHFTDQYMKEFLKEASFVFSITKPLGGFLFDITFTKKISLVGLVLIYKFLEYSVKNHSFYKPVCRIGHYVNNEITINGFHDLIYAFIEQKKEQYDKLQFAKTNDMFIAPIALDRMDAEVANSLFADKISQYYTYNDTICSVVLQILAEAASNFMGHAEEDTRSVLVARGDKNKFQLCCADTGIGIVESLRPIFKNTWPQLQDFQILAKSIEKGITSEPEQTSGHMGSGLWIINNYVTSAKGELHIYSGNSYLKNKSGKINVGLAPHWKGTIISLTLPLNKPESFQAAINNMEKDFAL